MNPPPSPAAPTPSESATAGGLRATATDTVDQIKSAATTSAARVRDQAQQVAADKKSAAADRVGGYGDALHASAKSLQEKDPNLAWFTHQAADRIERAADYLRQRDFRELRADAEDVARRHPAVFFGGLFVAGILLGNVLKSGSARTSGSTAANAAGAGDFSSNDTSDWAATTPAGGI